MVQLAPCIRLVLVVQVGRVFRQLQRVRVVRLVRLPQGVPLNQGNRLIQRGLGNLVALGVPEAQVVRGLGLQEVVRVADREGKWADTQPCYNMLSWRLEK